MVPVLVMYTAPPLLTVAVRVAVGAVVFVGRVVDVRVAVGVAVGWVVLVTVLVGADVCEEVGVAVAVRVAVALGSGVCDGVTLGSVVFVGSGPPSLRTNGIYSAPLAGKAIATSAIRAARAARNGLRFMASSPYSAIRSPTISPTRQGTRLSLGLAGRPPLVKVRARCPAPAPMGPGVVF